MERPKRAVDGGLIFHLLTVPMPGVTIFEKDIDYEAIERVLEQAVEWTGTDLFAWCIMPHHWHLVAKPPENGKHSKFVGWLSFTHSQRWHTRQRSTGSGHVFQGRFNSLPVKDEEHYLTLCRYVERNALRAKLIKRMEAWRWGSLWCWSARIVKRLALESILRSIGRPKLAENGP